MMGQGQTFQKILALVILVLIPVFLLKEYKILTLSKSFSAYADGEILKNEYAKTENKSFVIVIFSYEQDGYCEKNLQSVFSQSYPHFRVIYLNNGHGVESYNRARNFISKSGYDEKVTFIKNSNEKQLFDIFYQAIHSCKDDEIVIHLEGTDWLANDHVLEKLNKAYMDPDVWLTYGDYMDYPSLKKQEMEPTVNKMLREFKADKAPWMLSHLKTYYAGLLKELTPTLDGLNEKVASDGDKMLMLSLLKVGKWHVRFIPEVLSIHQEVKKSKELK